MQRTIFKWGTGQGIRLPKTIMDEACVRIGDTLTVTTNGRQIILEKAAPERKSIQDLFADYQGTYDMEGIYEAR